MMLSCNTQENLFYAIMLGEGFCASKIWELPIMKSMDFCWLDSWEKDGSVLVGQTPAFNVTESDRKCMTPTSIQWCESYSANRPGHSCCWREEVPESKADVNIRIRGWQLLTLTRLSSANSKTTQLNTYEYNRTLFDFPKKIAGHKKMTTSYLPANQNHRNGVSVKICRTFTRGSDNRVGFDSIF